MKKYILLAAAAISLAACNSEDNYMDEPVAAQISASIGESALSRASNVTWDKGDSIGISMSGRYTNLKYTTKNGNGTFDGTQMYFLNKTVPVTITAYYPYAGNENQTPEVIEISTSAEHQTSAEQPKIDFLYAVKENVTGSDPNVNLSFFHRMSKLTLIFKNGNDGTDVSKITSCEINGMILEGSFNPLTGICEANSDIPPAPINFTTVVKNEEELPPLIILPQAVNKVTMKIHDSEEQDYACELKFGENAIVAGNNYQFTITVKKTTLSVNSTITNWNTTYLDGEAKSDD